MALKDLLEVDSELTEGWQILKNTNCLFCWFHLKMERSGSVRQESQHTILSLVGLFYSCPKCTKVIFLKKKRKRKERSYQSGLLLKLQNNCK